MREPHEFLDEDIGTGDITSEALVPHAEVVASIIAKEACVVAGMAAAAEIFSHRGLAVTILVRDGARADRGDVVMRVAGDAPALLGAERLALNFVMRMSGIATLTRRLVDMCGAVNPRIRIAATRKTTPGIRRWEKDAVELGGGMRHREGLYDQYLIKDNHLAIVGSITGAVRMARAHGGARVVEVEVTDLEGAEEAARAGADIVMLDNFNPLAAKTAADAARKLKPDVVIEVSGGITPDNILMYAEFADVISLGWLTHSVKAMDFSLEILKQ